MITPPLMMHRQLPGEHPLPNDRQLTKARDDREQVSKVREAAEALFARKAQAERTEAPTSLPVASKQARREPRIFAMPVAGNFREEVVHQKPKPETSRRRVKVPIAQHDRIRTLVMYGITSAEVADLYGVPLNVIERIVGKGPMTAG